MRRGRPGEKTPGQEAAEIYCGLVSGYTAELVAFAGEKKLDKIGRTGG
jgi:hypothetical protein